MKEHFVNLLYQQLRQEYLLSRVYIDFRFEEDEDKVEEIYVDNLGVILDMIGYPKDDETELSRDWFYQEFTETPVVNLENLNKYLHWVCEETAKCCKENNLAINDFLNSLIREYRQPQTL
ncbi:hypothetical protein [Mesonia sp. K7]|uniref:hypothetical protein n=1 Tax=Mesonia sp. K7 TaxID=2218606 RepID=UPI0011B6DBE4|nr:hypothetical protein [Mesonia sp. K7]